MTDPRDFADVIVWLITACSTTPDEYDTMIRQVATGERGILIVADKAGLMHCKLVPLDEVTIISVDEPLP